jgi:esterase/lipase
VNVLGWSDGGIEALLLGIRHPAKVKKIVAMAAVPAAARDTPRGQRELKVIGMMLEEPNIEAKALDAITSPTRVLASDHDTIVNQHTVEIYQHIPNGQLAISRTPRI